MEEDNMKKTNQTMMETYFKQGKVKKILVCLEPLNDSIEYVSNAAIKKVVIEA